MSRCLPARLVLVLFVLTILSTRAQAQAPPVDPFLGVSILTTGASAPGQAVVANNAQDITVSGLFQPALSVSSLSGGYDASVLDPIKNFSAAPFSFTTTAVFNANGTTGTLGQPVTGHRVDQNGNTIAGLGGNFTLTAAGGFTFTPGTDFADVNVGSTVRVAVDYTLHGVNSTANTTRNFGGVLYIDLTKQPGGTFTQSPAADFSDYGSSLRPATDGKVFPDLQAFVSGLLRFSFAGNAGSPLTLTNTGNLTTLGLIQAYGISATTIGVRGSDGRDASITHSSTDGEPGGQGGTITLVNHGNISTCCLGSIGSVGIFAWSEGGDGGQGGDSGYTRNAKAGGPAGTGGTVTVNGNGTIQTFGVNASGILALSQGGNGGGGGDGSTFNGAENGANGGRGGIVVVDGSFNITTQGDKAYGIWGKSFGGAAGSGGDGGWTGTSAGGGGQGTEGGSVTITSGGSIRTSGVQAYGIFGQSIGGVGGDGGNGTSIFFASGGSGEKAGSGGTVMVTNNGSITTTGERAYGIFAESVGGGGGQGGSGGALVGLGGSGAGGGNAGAVEVVNNGTISATGVAARGIYAQSVGGGGGDGGSGSGFVGVGGSGSSTSDGDTVKVANNGSITSASSAIFAQSIGGGGGDGGSSVGLISVGGDGGAGGNAGVVTISSHGNLTTSEASATAVFAQSVGGGGGNGGNGIAGGVFFAAAIGGKGGVGGVGSDVTIGVNVDTNAVDPVTGTIRTGGADSNGIQAQSIGGGGGNGGFAIAASAGIGASASLGLGGQGGKGNHAADAAIYFGDANSRISTNGDNSNGILAQSIGGGGGNGGMSIAIALGTQAAAGIAFGGDGGTGGDAGTVTVGSATNPLLGLITTAGEHSYGVLAQSVGGGGGNGGLAVAGAMASKATASFAFGGTGANAGASSTVNLFSNATVETIRDNSHGLFAQSIGGGGGSGGAAVAGGISGKESFDFAFGGSGGAGGASGDVTLTSGGAGIITFGDKSYGELAQSIGGGGGDGGFTVAASISGDKGVNLGIGGNGGAASNSGIVTLTNSAPIMTIGDDSHAIFAQSTGGGGGSGGFSVAGSISKSGSFDAAIGGQGAGGGNSAGVTVINNATSVQTFGDRAYGILAQSIGGGGGDGGFAVAGGISQAQSVSLGIGGNGAGGGHSDLVIVTNHAAITTAGQLSNGIFAQSVGGGGGSGGFSIAGAISTSKDALSVSIGGNGGAGNYAGGVTVINTGAITTGGNGAGQGSYGILAQSIGGGGGAGGFSGAFDATISGQKNGKSMSVSVGGQGGTGEDSAAVSVTNGGAILTKAADSVGIFAQSIGGGGGDGGFSLSAALSGSQQGYDVGVSIGGFGGVAGDGKTVDVINSSQIETHGAYSQGIEAQSIGGGGGNGGFSVNADVATGKEAKSVGVSVGGSGGAAGDAAKVTVTNTASIATSGNDAMGIQAQSLGGGGGNGGFSISGSLAGAGGKTLALTVGGQGGGGGIGGEVDVTGTGNYTISTQGDRSIGIQAQSVGGGGGNGGFSGALALGVGGSDPKASSTSIGISVGGSGGTGDVAGIVNVGSLVTALKANITTAGADAVGIQAISLGGGGGNGGFSLSGAINAVPSDKAPNADLTFAVGGGGGHGNNGAAVLVNSEGNIFTSGDSAHGIQAESIGGGGGNGGDARALALQLGPKPKTAGDKKAANNNKKLAVSIGGNAGGASDGSTVTVLHTGDITTLGGDAHGIFAQSIGGGGGTGGDGNEGIPDLFGLPVADILLKKFDRTSDSPAKDVKIVVGGSGGSSGNANAVIVTNNGRITTYGDNSFGVFAQSIGGGGGAGGAGDLGTKGTVGVGGGTGSTGNGGTVNVNLSGAISTFGDGAHAVFAQSIGGGGGAAGDVERGLKNYLNIGVGLAFGQGGGNGGDGAAVTVTSSANLFTLGTGANGIFAQSIGGGGGVAGTTGDNLPILSVQNFAGSTGGTGSGNVVHVTQSANITTLGDAADGIFAQSAGGQQTGKAVTVTLSSGSILAYGAESNGIFAQSTGLGGRDNITVNIDGANSVAMGGTGTGAGVRFADGVQNALNNHGTITTVNGLAGTAIVGGTANETVMNYGTVVGSIDLGGGVNVLNNQSGGTLTSGASLKVGAAGTVINAGIISVGGAGNVATTTVVGNLTQAYTPKWIVDLGAGGTADRLAVSGNAQFGSSVTTLDFNALTLPTASSYTIATAAGGLLNTGFQFGTYVGDMPLGKTYGIATTDTDVQLTVKDSTGLFRWTGAAGTTWIDAFTNGKSNWSTDPSGAHNVYGTPGALTDVMVAKGAGISQLGADFTINSLRFDNAANPGAHFDTIIGGGNTLTLMAHDGVGISVDPGSETTTLALNLVLGANQSWINNSTGLLNIAGGSVTGSGRTLTIDGAGDTQIGASIQTGAGSVIKNGNGLLVLAGNNTYTGGTVLNAGTILGNTISLQGNIVNNATVAFEENGNANYVGVMTGTGTLIKQGGGSLTLGGANTYSGGTIVSAGTLLGTTNTLQGDILNLGTLIFDQSNTGIFAGGLSGNGTLIFRGGNVNLTGNSSGFTGATFVGGGRMAVNGWLGGSHVTLQQGGTLGGNGIVPAATFQAGSALAPGNSIGNLFVNGDATFEAGSSYQVETQAYGPSDLATIAGRLFASGAIVDARATGTKRYQPINRYVIATTGSGVGGTFAGVTSDASYLVPSLQYEGNNAYLTLRRNDVDFRSDGTVGNQTSVAVVFNRLVNVATGVVADSVNNLYDLSNGQALNALSTMTGVQYQYTAMNGLTSARAFMGANMRHLEMTDATDDANLNPTTGHTLNYLSSGAAGSTLLGATTPSASARDDHGFWVSGLGGAAVYKGFSVEHGANAPMVGLVVGVDTTVGDNVTLGVSGGQANPEIDMNGTSDQTKTRMLQFGGYGRVKKNRSYLNGAVNFGTQRNQVSRSLTDGVQSWTASSTYPGQTLTSQLNYGYAFDFGKGLMLAPQVGAQYGRLVLDATTEQGAGFLSLQVPSRVVDSTRSLVGVRLAKAFSNTGAAFTIEGRTSWSHEFSEIGDIHMQFAGDFGGGFNLAAPRQQHDSGNAGLTVAGTVARNLRLFATFDSEMSGPLTTWGGNLGIVKSW